MSGNDERYISKSRYKMDAERIAHHKEKFYNVCIKHAIGEEKANILLELFIKYWRGELDYVRLSRCCGYLLDDFMNLWFSEYLFGGDIDDYSERRKIEVN